MKGLARPATKRHYPFSSIFTHNTNLYPNWEHKHEKDQLQRCSRETGSIQSHFFKKAHVFQTHSRNVRCLANGLEINLLPLRRKKVYPYFLLHTDTSNRGDKDSFAKGDKQESRSLSIQTFFTSSAGSWISH